MRCSLRRVTFFCLLLLSVTSFAGVETLSKTLDLVYGGDATKIVNFAISSKLGYFNYINSDLYERLPDSMKSLPGKHGDNCKEFLAKEEKCPLLDDHLYVRYLFHDLPSSTAPVTGAYFVGLTSEKIKESLLAKQFGKKNIFWTSIIVAQDGRALLRPGYGKVPIEGLDEIGKDYDINYLKDFKVINTESGRELSWIRLLDSKERKPIWLNVDQLYYDEKGELVDKARVNEPLVDYLKPGVSFRISKYNRKTRKRFNLELTREIGIGADVRKYNLEELRGFYCFDRIENGKLYFRVQITKSTPSGERLPDPNFKLAYDLLEKRHKNYRDAIYSLDLKQYLADAELRHIFPGHYQCAMNTYHMDKGIGYTQEENYQINPALLYENDSFIFDYD